MRGRVRTRAQAALQLEMAEDEAATAADGGGGVAGPGTAADAAAAAVAADDAADAPHTAAAEAALAICVQQDASFLHDSGVACRLLATSKPLAALVRGRCSGALAVRWDLFKRVKSEAYGAWLSAHGDLLGDMELSLFDKPVKRGSVAPQGAKRQRPAPHPGLQVLAAVPLSVTRLVVTGPGVEDMDVDISSQQARALADRLRVHGMQLRSLQLPDDWHLYSSNVLLPAMASLVHLTSLRMHLAGDLSHIPGPGMLHFNGYNILGMPIASALQYLPLGLRQLDLCCVKLNANESTAENFWAPLTRLTALTSLTLLHPKLAAERPLPPSLRSLVVGSFIDAAPLLALTALTRLQLLAGGTGEQLARLSSLGSLAELDVKFGYMRNASQALVDASSSLVTLPLVHLASEHYTITSDVLGHLASCTRLTSLLLEGFQQRLPAARVADMLARLRRLERLELPDCVAADAPAGMEALVQAVVALPRLSSFTLNYSPGLGAAAAGLGMATSLTSLALPGCNVDDGGVTAICAGLATCLRELDLTQNTALTDACLASIRATQELTLLRLLRVPADRVTDHALHKLWQARPWLHIDMSGFDGSRI